MIDTRTIDCDSHIEESAVVWQHLDKKYRSRTPIPMSFPYAEGLPTQNAFWLIDGTPHPKPMGYAPTLGATPPISELALTKSYSVGSQDLTDVPARLKDMDAAGVDVQVLFPTLFLESLSEDVEFEAALIRSYHTWIADTCNQAPDRLKWAAVLPMRDVPATVKEMERCKKLGCVGIMVHGTVGGIMLHDTRFDPVWAATLDLNLPIGVHVAWSHPSLNQSADHLFPAQCLALLFPLVMGFWSFLGGGILDRFSTVRVGFLEGGVEWLPMIMARMQHYYKANVQSRDPLKTRKPPDQWLAEADIYISTEGDDPELVSVISQLGDDRVMMSADMPHGDAPVDLMPSFRERQDIPPESRRKILGPNAARFYQL